MQIEFRKIDRNLVSFNLKKDNLIFCGNLKKLNSSLVECQANIGGSLLVDCIRCAEHYHREIQENIQIKISDGIVSNTQDLDIVEMEGGYVDLDMIFESEIESYHCEYNICTTCQEKKLDEEG